MRGGRAASIGSVMGPAGQWGSAACVLLAPVLTLFLGFEAGGFFPGAPAAALAAVALALALRVLSSPDPFAGLTRSLALAAGALSAYAGLALASQLWSGSSTRALVEFDRAALYAVTLVLVGSLTAPRTLTWTIRALAVAAVALCAAALGSRLAPQLFPVTAALDGFGLSYPLTYANALGLIAALGLVLCFHTASDASGSLRLRALATGALPPLAAVLVLTGSSGALAVACAALIAYVALGKPAGAGAAAIPGGLAAALAVAWVEAQDAPVSGPAASSGDADGLLVVGLLAAAAALGRALLGSSEEGTARRPDRPLAALAGVAAVVAAAFAIHGDAPVLGLHDRPDQWRTALSAFARSPILGEGAGTYELA
jgi:hypothetical protein